VTKAASFGIELSTIERFLKKIDKAVTTISPFVMSIYHETFFNLG